MPIPRLRNQPPKGWRLSTSNIRRFKITGPKRITVNHADSAAALVILAHRIEKVIRYWEHEYPGCGWVTRVVKKPFQKKTRLANPT
jgi:hypothetical protein